MKALNIAIKSLFYRKKQYTSLFCVCILGISISLFCLFLMTGMLSSLEEKAKIYYGGDFTFIGGKNNLHFSDVDSFLEKLEKIFPEETVISKRFDFDADYAAFYFEGTGVRQRVIKGIDFTKEQELFKQFNYVEGNAENMANSQGILLSKPIADMLNVRVGDSITFMLKTAQGYTNTVPLIVHGIFKDSSLFGMYTSYVDFDYLLSAFGWPKNWANRICINLPENIDAKKHAKEYQKALEQEFNMFQLVDDKQIFYNSLLGGVFSKPTYALIELYANLEDLKILLDAMKLITTFIICMLLLIIVIGVSSTFRVIVMKRINEIGIYMAIGMQKKDIFKLILSETSVLIIFSSIAGFILSLILCKVSGFINFSFIPAFDIFLVNGKLLPLISLSTIFLVSALIYVTTILAVLFAIRKSVNIMPVKALNVTE